MKSSSSLKQTNSTSFLKVVNNSLSLKKEIKRIYINTLVPDFKYKSTSGEVVASNKCIPL